MPLAPKLDKTYTYGDYISWDDSERWELINGVPYNMSPAQSPTHQKILMSLAGQLFHHLKDKKCEIFPAPLDVRLPSGKEKENDIHTVVQPDISVICDKNKIDDKGCKGAPDLVVEIVSPSTASKDAKEKFYLYEKHGVKKYWIVRPEEKLTQVFKLGRDKQFKRPDMYEFIDPIKVGIFKDLTITLANLT